jgi:WD40 repeat protein/transcriptional regulator with XRE-family HTH domain
MPAMAEQSVLDFAGLLRQLRAEARLTQEELAEAASLSPRSVSDLERGINRTARKDTAELLAGALGLAEPARVVFVAAARGKAPAAEVLAAVLGEASAASDGLAPEGSLVWSGCPYLGLVPFGERDARVFYGRGELVAQLAQRLAGQLNGAGMLVVAGESGAGKSSLLRAGLMPWLAAGALGPGSQRWPRRVIQPTGRPVRELAMALAEVAGADPVSVYRSLLAAPGEAPMLVELAVRTAAGRGPAPGPGGPADAAATMPPRLVLMVDQVEELFTAGGDAEAGRAEREGFLAALHAAATVPAGPHELPAALVVVAVRADYLGRMIADPTLKAWVDAGLFTVGPMSEAEVRLAITGPAAEAGLVVEPALVEAVAAELREGAGAGLGSGVLPLMSQAMAATWRYREGSELTLRGYRRAGGVADAVNRSAHDAYDALTSAQQDAARLVFTQLTATTRDGQFARRRCSRADLRSPGSPVAADIDAVIDVFGAQRLLVLGQDSVEICHDALLQAWKQLREWLGGDQLDRALRSQVISDADTWESDGRDPAYLYRSGRLATIDAAATRWQHAPTRYPPLPATTQAFLDAARHAARRTTGRRRGAVAVLALLTALAVVASVVAFHQRAAAVGQRDQAIYNQVHAEALQFGTSDTTLAAQLTLAAYRLQPTQDLASRLLNTENTPLATSLATGAGFVNSVAFSRDGRTLARGDSDGTVRLWDIADPAHPRALGQPLTGGPRERVAGAAAGVTSVVFSPDGHTLASSDNGTVQLWAVADPAHPRPLGQVPPGGAGVFGAVDSVAFSPDGNALATGSQAIGPVGLDSTIQLWDIADPTRPKRLDQSLASGTPVNSVAFSRDGRTLASGNSDGTVRLWDIADPARPRPFGPIQARGTSVQSVVFSPDGHTLAGGSLDGTIRLWDLADPAHPQPLGPIQAGGAVDSVAFSPDGQTLAGGSLDGAIRLWDVTDPAHPSPLGQPLTGGTGAVDSVAFSPDRHTLASGSTDGTVWLWDVADPAHPRPLGVVLTGASALSVAFSPKGHTLASGSLDDDAVRLWDVAHPTHPRLLGPILPGGGDQAAPALGISSVAFSPDGHTLAIGDLDSTVKLFDVADPEHSSPLGLDLTGTSIYSLAFSPEGRILAGGHKGGTIQLWDVADPANLRRLGQPLTGGGAQVNSVAFSPDGHALASGSLDGTTRLWDLADPAHPGPLGQPLSGSTVAVDSVAFSPDEHTLASGSHDGTTRLWNLNVQSAINRICATAGGLTPQQWNEYIRQLPYRTTCAR